MEPPWIVPGILGYYVFQDSGIPPMGFLTSEYLVSQESWDTKYFPLVWDYLGLSQES